MKCPQCFHNGSKVVDSRPSDEGATIRRRRECESCQYRFTTFERIEKRPLLVVKKNKDREEFDPSKILRGVHRAFEKRPFSAKDREEVVERIEARIREEGKREIASEEIGEYVMQELIRLDEVAYIRFASVYRQFQDIDVFMEEMRNIEGIRGEQSKEDTNEEDESF